ncbi:hypothetical protein RUM43_003518 [Polyplax serrata]|uniref:Uncharacterized protein n=1 Tax=Polyplax serrata TaxID=468196 RepID=A0AAN8NWV9_POLSC
MAECNLVLEQIRVRKKYIENFIALDKKYFDGEKLERKKIRRKAVRAVSMLLTKMCEDLKYNNQGKWWKPEVNSKQCGTAKRYDKTRRPDDCHDITYQVPDTRYQTKNSENPDENTNNRTKLGTQVLGHVPALCSA